MAAPWSFVMLETRPLAEHQPRLGEFGFAGDDQVVPYEVAPLDVRGRTVQLGPMLDAILSRHDYPEPVARLLAEACVLTVLLGTSLKFEGKFILQTRTDGPVDMLVADFTTPDALRAYARFDADRLWALSATGETSQEKLLGTGVLALTIDQGAHTQRYQGIVQLDGTSLEDAARTYFRQSEQIPTDLRMSVAKLVTPGPGGAREQWRAGGILAQFLPQSPERVRVPDISGGDGDPRDVAHEPDDNSWQELLALLGTIEPTELIDPTVGAERLLYRLFHEHGVRVFRSVPVADQCSCSREKIRGILEGFSADEIKDSTEDGGIHVACEFCSTQYDFDPAEFSAGE
ncbi:MAG: Hsp33 family molecular chaperone [Mesorhizobium sp.]|uniref:Hsp33 family molecular chaperone n=1 Tax=Mesorhizobium sp. TaxID=1871066 RepID=UPI000FE7FB43|nr:Hsp33 family molecular chaperone [Mesorhizobium sp.]RWM09478.1 MAG: Hsp33 family molecular chaperone [Mesorhizobium sp.]TIO51631.1 MAG: Hsp33 family molecular chaperone [Mesorhizobium sp.]TIO61957.1 MAG: Hsp33 family molecular chaperone [Mesorhizobium sp.]TJV65004.1 MAG: Hsp33 family molecular chaperone [Mesorhizobium sp.]